MRALSVKPRFTECLVLRKFKGWLKKGQRAQAPPAFSAQGCRALWAGRGLPQVLRAEPAAFDGHPGGSFVPSTAPVGGI